MLPQRPFTKSPRKYDLGSVLSRQHHGRLIWVYDSLFAWSITIISLFRVAATCMYNILTFMCLLWNHNDIYSCGKVSIVCFIKWYSADIRWHMFTYRFWWEPYLVTALSILKDVLVLHVSVSAVVTTCFNKIISEWHCWK